MYTKETYKEEIKQLILERGYDPVLIGKKSSHIFFENVGKIDDALRNALLDVATMEDGAEYWMTKEEFMEFLEKM